MQPTLHLQSKNPPKRVFTLATGLKPARKTIASRSSVPEPTAPPAADEVPPADAPAPPTRYPTRPAPRPCPGVRCYRRPGRGDTFMPCVLPVFCDAEVDWFVVALEFMRALLLLPRICAPDCTPVAAFGFTYCSGLVCALWLAPVACRALGAGGRSVCVPDPRVCLGGTFMPCVLPVFCDAEVDWFVVALEFMRMLLLLPLDAQGPTARPSPRSGSPTCIGLVCAAWLASGRLARRLRHCRSAQCRKNRRGDNAQGIVPDHIGLLDKKTTIEGGAGFVPISSRCVRLSLQLLACANCGRRAGSRCRGRHAERCASFNAKSRLTRGCIRETFTTSAHRAISRRICSPNTSGATPPGSEPSAINRSCNSRLASAVLTSECSRPNDRRRRPLRNDQPLPRGHVELRQPDLRRRRHFTGCRDPALRGDRMRAELAVSEIRDRAWRLLEAHLHLPRDEIGERGPGALVGNVDRLESGLRQEQLHHEMRGAAGTRGRIVELSRLRSRQRHELAVRCRRNRRMRDEEHGRDGSQRHRRKIPERIVRQLAEGADVGRKRADGAEEERMTVRGGAGRDGRGDVAAAPGAVVHHHLLPESFGQLRADRARHDVGGAAGREGDDRPDGMQRIALGSTRRAARPAAPSPRRQSPGTFQLP